MAGVGDKQFIVVQIVHILQGNFVILNKVDIFLVITSHKLECLSEGDSNVDGGEFYPKIFGNLAQYICFIYLHTWAFMLSTLSNDQVYLKLRLNISEYI